MFKRIVEQLKNISKPDKVEMVLKDILKQHKTEMTELGEPQAWIYLDKDRSMEVVEERNGLEKKNYFYSCRLHCSEEEFENDKYYSSMGIIETYLTKGLDLKDLKRCIQKVIDCNNRL